MGVINRTDGNLAQTSHLLFRYWGQLISPNLKTCSPLWSLHQMSSDGIDKKLLNKKSE